MYSMFGITSCIISSSFLHSGLSRCYASVSNERPIDDIYLFYLNSNFWRPWDWEESLFVVFSLFCHENNMAGT